MKRNRIGVSSRDSSVKFLQTAARPVRCPSSEELELRCSLNCIVIASGHKCPGSDYCEMAIESDHTQRESDLVAEFMGSGFSIITRI